MLKIIKISDTSRERNKQHAWQEKGERTFQFMDRKHKKDIILVIFSSTTIVPAVTKPRSLEFALTSTKCPRPAQRRIRCYDSMNCLNS